MTKLLDAVIITGMSGAGKTVAMQSFEDLGYFCIDNMPPNLLSVFWNLAQDSGKITKVALVVDLRSRAFFEEILTSIAQFNETANVTTRILFLDSSNEALVSRYKETRRNHPLLTAGGILTDAIQLERDLLMELKSRAQYVIDTTHISPRQLREQIMTTFNESNDDTFSVRVVSFGFKYGVPIESDLLMDVRFLPNPYYVPELRPLTGLDQPVYDYVMAQEATETFFQKYANLVEFVLPGYRKEGKMNVTIGIGCTGGQHRSVALAEKLGNHLKTLGYQVAIAHRDREKRKETVNRS